MGPWLPAAFTLGLFSQGPVYEQYDGNIKKLDAVDYCIILRLWFFLIIFGKIAHFSDWVQNLFKVTFIYNFVSVCGTQF